MAVLIDRQALRANVIKFLNAQHGISEFAFDNCFPYWIFAKEIANAPAVDAVEVVRCKDCKKNPNFSKTSGKHMVWCRKWRCEVKENDFCNYGERRVDNAAD